MADKEPEKKNPPAAEPAGEAPQEAGKEDGKKKKKLPLLTNLSAKEKSLGKITGLFLIVVLMDFIVIRPVNNYLNQLNDKIRVEETVIPKRLLILKHKNKILGEYNSFKAYMTPPTLSQEEETARFLREIERVSKEANLFVSNINPVKVTPVTDNVYELSLDIEGRGGVDEIRRFMKNLETSNPGIRISGFNIRPQGKESEELKYSFSILKIGVRARSSAAPQS